VKSVRASEDRGDPGNGSQPRRLVLCDDGNVYRIKWPDDPLGEKDGHFGQPSKEMFSEFLACRIAPKLGLSTPEYALVDVPASLSLRFAGPCFGSRLACDYEPLPDGSYIVTFQEEHDRISLYALLAFDELLRNPDRKAGDFLRRKTERPLPRPFLAVDHSNSFGGSHWSREQLMKNRDRIADTDQRWLFLGLNDAQTAARAVEQVLGATIDFDAVVRDVCGHGGLSEDDQASVIEFLTERWKNLLCLVASALRAA
jgi:hypothetical protein